MCHSRACMHLVEAMFVHLVEHRLQARLADGAPAVQEGQGRPIKPEYYCGEYRDAIDVCNAALVTALKEARAFKCEVLRQQALRQIRKRKREVPDKPAAMWKIAKIGPGTFALEITMMLATHGQEKNPLLRAAAILLPVCLGFW